MDGPTLVSALDGSARVVALAKAALVAVIACVVCALLGAGVGAWLGIEWQQGRHAQAELSGLRAETEDLLAASKELRQRGVDITTDFRTAAMRMDAIAQENERASIENQTFYREQTGKLAQLLRERPDLDAVDVGADLLCNWNRNLQGAGPSAASPAPGCAGQPAPGAAAPAAGQRQPAAVPARQPAGRDRGVQRLPPGEGKPGEGRGRIRGDRVGVVLQSDRRDGSQRSGMHGRRPGEA